MQLKLENSFFLPTKANQNIKKYKFKMIKIAYKIYKNE